MNELLKMKNGITVDSASLMAERRAELISVLEKNAYGVMPGVFGKTEYEIIDGPSADFAGKADVFKLIIKADTGNGIFSFPVKVVKNKTRKISPLFVFINFSSSDMCHYCPSEEILDNGFSYAYLWYEDISSDDNCFTNGLAAFYDRNKDDAAGKITLWAWALSRIVDAAQTWEFTDKNNIAVVGHSRLGKTALWCGANDERIKFVISNDSGCMGASLEEGKHEKAETQKRISEIFPFWFCPKFNHDAQEDVKTCFDQHFLLAASSPRYVLVASGKEDLWADPANEYKCCKFASPAFEACGVEGFVADDDDAVTDKVYDGGHIAYHRRKGPHFLSREDWNFFMNFINSHLD